MTQTDLNLENRIALELNSCMTNVTEGAEFSLDASNKLLYLLEYYIPVLLLERYPELGYLGLDGFYLTCARKTGPRATELYGWAILLDDPGVTPFHICLIASTSGNSISSYRLLLGEPGHGRLGISRKLGSGHLIETRDFNLDAILWKYSVSSKNG